MDQQQQHHHQHISDDHNFNLSGAPYGFHQQDQDSSYAMQYGQQMQPYQQVNMHPGAPPRGFRNVLYHSTKHMLIT